MEAGWRRWRIVVAALAVLVAVSGVHLPAAAQPVAAPTGAERFVVRFDSTAGPAARAAALDDAGYALVEEMPDSDYALVAATGPAPIATDDAIVEVEPLRSVHAAGPVPDPLLAHQWHLHAIRAPETWPLADGAGAVVAVIDSGIADPDPGGSGRSRAPDLAGTAFVPGWDFVEGDAVPQDEHGHGTHVTSTIAATTGNGIGVAGVAPGATVMVLRVLDGDGWGKDWHVAQALRRAADQGAHVANLSLGTTDVSPVVRDAIDHARSNGVTVVAASGNEGQATVAWPPLPGVITVGAVRLDHSRAAYSNHGPTLDLVAPGGDMTRDQDGDGHPDGILQETLDRRNPGRYCFCYLEGTSMATPQVSGIAAMVVGLGVVAPAEVERILAATAWDLGPPGRDDEYGHGLVDAHAAVVHAAGGPAPTTGQVRAITGACPPGRVTSAGFADVDGGVHAAAVDCVVWWGVGVGRSATQFEPRSTITRAQVASFIARLAAVAGIELPQEPPDAFDDDAGSVHEHRIDQLAALGVVRGRSARTYDPAATVTRAEMATLLARTHDLVADRPLRTAADRFRDDQGSTHERNIDRIAAVGVAAGTSPSTFAPTAPVHREQMATFLARLLDLLVDDGVVPAR